MPSTAYWQRKVVLITGASAGLGAELARAWAAEGAKVVLAARGAEALEAIAGELRGRGADVLAVPCDVTDPAQIAKLFEQLTAVYSRLDVLVNNVGRSTRGRAIESSPDEFRELLEINFLSAVQCTRAAAPMLEASRGHVVNIGSLAGKSAARWLGAYPPSKFALSAYSQQLRLEWAEAGVHVLLVCTGPIARDAARTYSGASDLPEAAQRAGGGIRTRAIDPDDLARRIVRACEKRQPELVVPGRARLLLAVAQLFPRLGDYLVRRLTS